MDIDEIYSNYFEDIYMYIYRMSGSKEIAEDITAETFLKAMKKIDTFRGECSIHTWLCTIARNTYSKYRRKHARETTLDECITPAQVSDDLEDRVADHDEALRIRHHLHDLPDIYKEVFMWRVFADLSFEDIGAMFGKSANWACVTYHRAKKKISEKMEEEK